MNFTKRSRLFLASTVLALTIPGASLMAQGADNEQHLEDFAHYVFIAKPDLAEAHLRSLLDSGISNADLARLVTMTMSEERFESALTRGREVLRLTDIIAELETRYRTGLKALSRDPERINLAVQDLTGTLRQQRMAEEVLLEAGEYAVPALLKVVTDGKNPTQKQKAVAILEQIGQKAVPPLSVALLQVDPVTQERIASILARIGSDQAVPFLADLASDSSAPASSREAAERAVNRLGGMQVSVADEYASLAREYFVFANSMLAYPAEATNNLWTYDSFVGLVQVPVPTPIFGEVMAMSLARQALQLDSSHTGALTTFVAANLKRENDLPDGEIDPVYGNATYSPEFYAMAAGPSVAQNVLGLSLDMQDTVLIRDAIDVLDKTAGASNLFTGSGSDPVLAAMMYPDRRVRYDAALALGKALPAEAFESDYMVVPTLASAIRAGGDAYAIVIAGTREDQDTFATALDQAGFTVVARGSALSEMQAELAQAIGVDLAVVVHGADRARQTIDDLRNGVRTSVAPVLVMATGVDEATLRPTFEGNPLVTVRATRQNLSAFPAMVDEAMRTSGGRISEADAIAYSIEAIETLYDIAISNSPVFNIADAETALVAALRDREGTIRHRIAGVLAYIPTQSAQRAIFNTAINAQGDDRIELLKRVALSAKMNGNMLEQRHVAMLVDLIAQGGPASDAAGRLHGALNLNTSNVVTIISQ